MSLRWQLTDTPDAAVAELGRQLAAYIDATVGPSVRTPLAITVHQDGDLVAGLNGMTAWGWLYVQWLWVAESQRGQGLAGALLARAEDEARSRGCTGAHIDTFNPQARARYEAAGYALCGEIPDFVAGRSRCFLSKRF
ncbi:GNAT family N-acetyltransferase [Oceanicola sp. S124]|uniref:GNAT family N-acetyltransferase n=1 Tax=Oceanicola sp. S124 TaxID=1042378 RepID=UPI0002559A1E|nr:GNAT family N-acetyltransferase [Oceanicola sp. S124]